MSSIDIAELIDYLSCSYRSTFKRGEKLLNSFPSIKAELYSRLIDYCLLEKLVKKDITSDKLAYQLNYIWSDLKSKFIIPSSWALQLTLLNRLATIRNWINSVDLVTGFKLPGYITIDDIDIIYTYSTYKSLGTKYNLIKIDNTFSGFNTNSFIVRLIASMIKKSSSVIVLKLDTCDFLEPITITNPEKYLSKILTQYKLKIQIPSNELSNCASCNYKSFCIWNSSPK